VIVLPPSTIRRLAVPPRGATMRTGIDAEVLKEAPILDGEHRLDQSG
jgi:hypothetical protein